MPNLFPKVLCQRFENILGSLEGTTHQAGEGRVKDGGMEGRRKGVCYPVDGAW